VHIICTSYNPLFPWHKFCRSHWNYCQIYIIQLNKFQIPAQLIFSHEHKYAVYLAALKFQMISPWSVGYRKNKHITESDISGQKKYKNRILEKASRLLYNTIHIVGGLYRLLSDPPSRD
jgi:hypothetical protein